MKRIADYRSFLESDPDVVCRLLEEWKPNSSVISEKDQEGDLFSWLQKQLLDVPIIAQYGLAKGKADIVIEESHMIELKLAFKLNEASSTEFDRCIGQLWRYAQKWVKKERGHVYLVVIGDSDAEFRDLLHTWFKETNSPYFFSRFHLIEKRAQ
jgi:hypothetical protein